MAGVARRRRDAAGGCGRRTKKHLGALLEASLFAPGLSVERSLLDSIDAGALVDRRRKRVCTLIVLVEDVHFTQCEYWGSRL
jgi:hypothetical protein